MPAAASAFVGFSFERTDVLARFCAMPPGAAPCGARKVATSSHIFAHVPSAPGPPPVATPPLSERPILQKVLLYYSSRVQRNDRHFPRTHLPPLKKSKKINSACFVALGLVPDGAHSVLKGTQRAFIPGPDPPLISPCRINTKSKHHCTVKHSCYCKNSCSKIPVFQPAWRRRRRRRSSLIITRT